MPCTDPTREVLACIARLRAAIADERAALDGLDLDRLEALADQRRSLDEAWADLVTSFHGSDHAAQPQLAWARRQMLADIEALRATVDHSEQRLALRAATFEALAAALEPMARDGEAEVVPIGSRG
jgi:hypothetical protein